MRTHLWLYEQAYCLRYLQQQLKVEMINKKSRKIEKMKEDKGLEPWLGLSKVHYHETWALTRHAWAK